MKTQLIRNASYWMMIWFLSFSISGFGQIISQYVETNSGTTPKGIEIWNNTGSTLDFSTNNLVIEKGTNGGVPSADFTLSAGTMASGDVIVIGTSDMEATTSGNGSVFHLKGFTFNGDDALVVKYGGTTTDVFGNPGSDPGSAWTGNGVSTANQNIQLKSDINTGDTDGWTDPSERFETVSTTPSGSGGLEGFGIAPVNSTVVQFVSTSATINEGVGSYNIELEISNPSSSSDTECEVELTVGNSGDIGGFTDETVTFIAGSSDNDTISITITNDAIFEGNESFLFEITSVSSGDGAQIGVNNEFTLIISDNDDPEIYTLPYSQDFEDCNDQYWTAYSISGDLTWSCSDGGTNGYMSIDGGEDIVVSDDYLVSPKINLDNFSNEVLSFRTSKQGNDALYPTLDLYYSTDFSGDPGTATWNPLSANWATGLSYVNSGAVDLSGIIGASVYLAFQYRSSSVDDASLWRIDDINIVESSLTTDINAPATQVAAASISSLADTEEEKIHVFSFDIEDDGSDALNTIVTHIRIKPADNNTAILSQHIQGIILSDGTSDILLEDVQITNAGFEISIESGDLMVADGDIETIELSLYLNDSEIEDQSVLAFKIDKDDHGFESDASGSRFLETLAVDVVSNDFTINVVPTDMIFIQQPTTTDLGDVISPAVTVAFVDENENIDINSSGNTISISATGATISSGSTSENIVSTGLASFDDLILTQGNPVTLTATDGNDFLGVSATVVSEAFSVVDIPQLIISEIADPADDYEARFIEIYNAGTSSIDFDTDDYYLCRQSDNGNWEDYQLSGSISANSAYTIANSENKFNSAFGFAPDDYNGNFNSNGDDSYYLYKDDDHSNGILIDAYGVVDMDGTGEAWEFLDTKAVRIGSITEPNSSWDSTEWHIPTSANVEDMTPGEHKSSVSWQGTSGTDWNTKGNNWSGTYGYIPDASFDVSIATQSNLPTISEEAATHDLTINSGSLTVDAAQSLRVFETLTNNAGASALVLKADANGPSSLIHENNGVAATVESYFDDFGGNNWYLISSPITDATANIFYDQYLDYWDETIANWVSIVDETTPLVPGRGYSLKKDLANLAIYNGTLNNGDIIISNMTQTIGGDYFSAGWNLVGNPYPSVLDIASLNFGENITAAASVWPHGNTGPYLNWSQGTGGDIEARYIQPGQGFMIQLIANNQSITFTNSARTHTHLDSFDKDGQDAVSLNSLKISLSDLEGRSDNTYIKFTEEASTLFDPYFDVHKLIGNASYPHVFSYIDLESDEKASIQAQPFPLAGEVIHLGIQTGQSGNFSLSVRGSAALENDQEVLLIDHLEQEFFNLKEDSIILIHSNSNDPQNRFDLLFDRSTAVEALKSEKCKVYFTNDHLIIHQTQDEFYDELVVFNLLGQPIESHKLEHSQQMISINLPSSYYIVKLRNQDSFFAKKIFINR